MQLISWQEALTIAAVIFAITQFIENSKLRKYLFSLGKLNSITVFLIALPLVLVIVSTINPITLLPFVKILFDLLNIYFKYVTAHYPELNILISNLNYPAVNISIFISALKNPLTYQFIALICFTILIFIYLLFLKFPKLFKPKLNEELLDRLASELIYNLKSDDLAALSEIISSNIEKIIILASRVPRGWGTEPDPEPKTKLDNLQWRCLQFIEVDLSGENFINFISKDDVRFIIRFIKFTEENTLWKSKGSIFLDNLFNQLMKDKNSVLAKESKFGGYGGIIKPISSAIFESTEIIENYDVFGALGWGSDVSELVLRNVTTGLNISLKKYFTIKPGEMKGNPSWKLSRTIENLGETYSSMTINLIDKDDVWKNEYAIKISIIDHFFDRLQWILTPRQEDPRWGQPKYDPIFLPHDLQVQENSVSYGIVEGFFKILESLTWIRDEEYSRIRTVSFHWVFFDLAAPELITSIQLKLLEKIKERVNENFNDQYPSMIKLFINLYGFSLWGEDKRNNNNPIAIYFKEITKTKIFPEFIKNEKFRNKNMPANWTIDKNGNIYTTGWNNKKTIVFKKPKKTKNKTKSKKK